MGLCFTKPVNSPSSSRLHGRQGAPAHPPQRATAASSSHSAHALAPRPPSGTGSAAGMAPRQALGAFAPASPRTLAAERDQLLQRIQDEGARFRSTSEDREEFKAAYFAKYGSDAEYMWNETAALMEDVRRSDPALRQMEIADLIALRIWTTGDYVDVQDVLETSGQPNATGLAHARPLLSALHSLPDSYTHTGPVFTGEDQSAAWVRARHREGQVAVNQRFFATSETREGAWQNMPVEWETASLRGKRISAFSANPREKEVLFPPGTLFRTDSVELEGKPIRIRQSEVQP